MMCFMFGPTLIIILHIPLWFIEIRLLLLHSNKILLQVSLRLFQIDVNPQSMMSPNPSDSRSS